MHSFFFDYAIIRPVNTSGRRSKKCPENEPVDGVNHPAATDATLKIAQFARPVKIFQR